MCYAIEFIDNINNQITEAKQYYNKLKKELNLFECAKLDIEHDMENFDNLDMYSGWKLYKKMNKIRHERRRVKNELVTMDLLIKQLNNFKIEKEEISLTNKRLKNQIKKKERAYIPRVLKPNEDLDCFINNSKSKINSNNNITTKNNKNETGVYYIASKLPKEKGSTIKVKFKDEKQKQHIVNKLSYMYRDYCINEDNSLVELIYHK